MERFWEVHREEMERVGRSSILGKREAFDLGGIDVTAFIDASGDLAFEICYG